MENWRHENQQIFSLKNNRKLENIIWGIWESYFAGFLCSFSEIFSKTQKMEKFFKKNSPEETKTW